MFKQLKNRLIWHGLYPLQTKAGAKCIVMYHGIDQSENMRFNVRFFSQSNFEKQVQHFKKHYHVVSLEDYFLDQNLSKDKINIAITFDDGYQNNLSLAAPILEKYNMPATFFVTGVNTINEPILWADLVDISTQFIKNDHIDFNGEPFYKNQDGRFASLKKHIKSKRFVGTDEYFELKKVLLDQSGFTLDDPVHFDYWKLLTDEEITQLGQSKFITVGSHSLLHNNLASLDLNDAILEMKESKSYLENLLQYEVNSIGFPDGSYTPDVSAEALKLGFKYQCAVHYHFNESIEHKTLKHRLGLYPIINVNYMDFLIGEFVK